MSKSTNHLYTAKTPEYLGVHRNTIHQWAARCKVPMHPNPVIGFQLFTRSDSDKSLKDAARPVSATVAKKAR